MSLVRVHRFPPRLCRDEGDATTLFDICSFSRSFLRFPSQSIDPTFPSARFQRGLLYFHSGSTCADSASFATYLGFSISIANNVSKFAATFTILRPIIRRTLLYEIQHRLLWNLSPKELRPPSKVAKLAVPCHHHARERGKAQCGPSNSSNLAALSNETFPVHTVRAVSK